MRASKHDILEEMESREVAAMGGHGRAKNLPKKRRKAIAATAAAARWKGHKKNDKNCKCRACCIRRDPLYGLK